MKVKHKEYLGDSVYLEYDGYMMILTTDNGTGASNTIFMEPEVVDAFIKLAKEKHHV